MQFRTVRNPAESENEQPIASRKREHTDATHKPKIHRHFKKRQSSLQKLCGLARTKLSLKQNSRAVLTEKIGILDQRFNMNLPGTKCVLHR